MKKLTKFAAIMLAMSLTACSACVSAADKRYDKSYSPKSCNVKSYKIDVKVNADKHVISGKVTARFKNNTGKTLKKLCVRNYASSILGKKGSSVLSGAKLGKKKLTLKAGKDKSVLYADLGKNAVKKGKAATFSVKFKTDIPKKNDRFGYHGKKGGYFINLSYCFPELAAYVDGKWAEYPYFKSGECNFNRIKDYSVTVHAPKYLKVISVGNEKQSGGTTKITAKRVRDMAIVLSDTLKRTSKKVKGVTINYYGHTNKHMKTYNELQLEAAADSFRLYTEKFGAYPYKELDVIADYVHGMEFSGLVMCGFPDLGTLDKVEELAVYYDSITTVVHEVAHQWFYNLVGNNPYTEPWLDEGLAEYCEEYLYQFANTKTIQKIKAEDARRGFGEGIANMGYDMFIQFKKSDYDYTVKKYKGKINLPCSAFKESDDYSTVIYHSGAYFMHCLQKAMGDKNFFKMMRGYCRKFAYKEATTQDFVKNVYKYDSSKKVKKIVEKFIK